MLTDLTAVGDTSRLVRCLVAVLAAPSAGERTRADLLGAVVLYSAQASAVAE